MYLVGHTAVGIAAVTALGIQNPVAAFGIGWLSHYVADFFPHGDEPAGEWAKRGKSEVARIVMIFAVDCLIVFTFVAAFISHRGWSWPAFFAALGSTIPDVFWGLDKVFKREIFRPMSRLHIRNHNFFQVRMPLWLGLVLQAIVAGSLWAWIILR